MTDVEKLIHSRVGRCTAMCRESRVSLQPGGAVQRQWPWLQGTVPRGWPRGEGILDPLTRKASKDATWRERMQRYRRRGHLQCCLRKGGLETTPGVSISGSTSTQCRKAHLS